MKILQSFLTLLVVFVLASSVSGQEDKPAEQKHSGHSYPVDENGNPKFTNALAKESSPYLLQHAHNPVNWYPWNETTLKKAKDEGKVIFLSIGYSSCHWCHVMERESFMDEEIAKLMNEKFICIKVDREERPDVDKIYMESLEALNQIMRTGRGGGWPLSMFLTPDGRPFFGGTYMPARDGDRGARVGFFTLLKKVDENWVERKDRIEKDAATITDYAKRRLAGEAPPKDIAVQSRWIKSCQEKLAEDFDPEFGGFRFDARNTSVPKFPEPSNLLFLLHQSRKNPEDFAARNMVVKTCERMMLGGIYDHLGGGFHRYSVDRFWAIPHFEKMLYDNGQLAVVYTELYELTKRPEFKEVVDGIMSFVKREMLTDEGGFYSALDAESEGEEGKFNRWEIDELKEALTEEEFKLFASVYRIDEAPNFEGKYYAPQLKQSLAAHAKSKGISRDELQSKLAPIRKKLFEIREKRERPLTDTKVLSSWNGMMIRGFADAGRVFKNQDYIDTAAKAADFAIANLFKPDGRLFRTHTAGESKLNAYLDDYASMIDGLLALHRATGDAKWLDQAKKAQTIQNKLFWDDTAGGYFFTSNDHEVLIARSKNPIDGAVPSGNSVSAGNLLYMAEVAAKAGDDEEAKRLKEKTRRTIIGQSGMVNRVPHAAPRLMISADQLLNDK